MVELVVSQEKENIILLSLIKFGVCFGKRKILVDINLDIAETGVTHLMGPCGAGKSTLLRSLAGLNDLSSTYHAQGEVCFKGEALGILDRPKILEQKPSGLLDNVLTSIISKLPERSSLSSLQQRELVFRLLNYYNLEHLKEQLNTPLTQLDLADRRIVLIMGLVTTAPAMILLDEPTADLSKSQAKMVLDVIKNIALKRTVLLVQHNQEYALYLGGRAILLAGGTIQEDSDTKAMLTAPQSIAGKEFKGSGTCAAPSPNTDPEMLDDSFRHKYQPKVAKKEVRPVAIPFGPQGFRWIIRNSLAAMPRPGLRGDLEFDLKSLAKVKVSRLVTLEEQRPLSDEKAMEYGIEVRHVPIVDMQAPSLAQAELIVTEMQQWVIAGETVAVHCKAGLGRTGTILACYFISQGLVANEAIHKIRCNDARMIQSQEQEQFIEEFSEYWMNK